MSVYVQCGMRIESELALDLPTAEGGQADVVVTWGGDTTDSAVAPPGEVIATLETTPGEWWYIAAETSDGICVRFANCGEVVISPDLSRLVVRRDPDGRHDILPILLAGTVSALLLLLRGSVVLHASAVAHDSTALAFVGQSGRGKSTMAALMCLDGASLVTDDVLAVDPGPPITCMGGASELRLREKAAHLADADTTGTSRLTADERRTFAPARAPHVPLPLGAIVVPSPDPASPEIAITRLSANQAFGALMRFPRIEGVRRRDLVARQFAVYGSIANTIPVYHAIVPWGPPFRDDIAPRIRSLVDEPLTAP